MDMRYILSHKRLYASYIWRDWWGSIIWSAITLIVLIVVITNLVDFADLFSQDEEIHQKAVSTISLSLFLSMCIWSTGLAVAIMTGANDLPTYLCQNCEDGTHWDLETQLDEDNMCPRCDTEYEFEESED